MPYRAGGNARERAEQRLQSVRERLELARELVEQAASELADARRKLELCRVRAGAGAAELRQLDAQIAAGIAAADCEQRRAAASSRLADDRAEAQVLELTIVERWEALRQARRDMNAAAAERRDAEAELARVTS